MIVNILPEDGQVPSLAVRHHADLLLNEGNVIGSSTNAQAHSFLDKTPGAANGYFHYLSSLRSEINSVNGADKGPSREACQIAEQWLDRAIICRYDISNTRVRRSLAHFILSVVTEGFEGSNSGGTTIGNFKGDWRGGGFFDYDKMPKIK